MKTFYLLLSILVFSLNAGAQPNATASDANGSVSGNGGAPAKPGKVDLPPEKTRPMTVPLTSTAPVIDGHVDEDVWKQASVFKDFYQTYPGDNIAASKPTEVLLMYDEHNLYIAFKCWDERDKIRATVAKRDNVFGEDNVRMWLDTFNDQRRAYVLGFNPLGIQQDGIFTEGQGADFSVDIVMESKGVIEDWGWSVEVKIPFKSLRYSAGKGKLWGFNAARNIDRFNDEFDQWLPDDRNVSGFLIKHGKLAGLDEIKYERTLELVPSITVSETGRKVRTISRQDLTPASIDPGRFVNQPIKTDIGLNLKYTISPALTLDAAINPDFAEIEADAPVITTNQRFPIFFEEKRPFFLEGADIFRSPFQIFYSRTIEEPDLAIKLTGKKGKTTYGLLAASDAGPGGNFSEEDQNDPFRRPKIDEFIGKDAQFAVLRVKRDFGAENNVGFFGTYRSFPEQKNLVAAIDGRFKYNPRLVSTFQVIGTNSKRCFFDPEFETSLNPTQAVTNMATCGGGTYNGVTVQGSPYNQYKVGNGLGYYFNLDYTTDQHGWFLEAGGRTKYYRADAGFTRRANSHFLFFFNRFSSKSRPKSKLIRTAWNQMSGYNYDDQGRLQNWNAQTNLNLNLQRSTFVTFSGGVTREKIYEEEFGLKRSPTRFGAFGGEPFRATWQQWASANLNQTPTKRFNYGIFLGFIRNAFDYFDTQYSPAADTFLLNPGQGLQLDAQVYAEYKPIDPWRISATYTKRRLTRNDNKAIRIDSDLLTIRSTYQFSRFLFTRFRLDYDDSYNGFSGQALFGWNPNPGTAFYVGYNDAFKYNGLSEFTGQYEPGFNRSSRTFFIRASYLFRKSF